MKHDQYSRIEITDQEAFEAIYSGILTDLKTVALSEGLDQFLLAKQINADSISSPFKLSDLSNVSIEDFDKSNQTKWFMPENYCNNIIEHIYSLCSTEDQRSRVDKELLLYAQYDLFDLLKYLKYLVDTMRANRIVWGVGRGSCVASYVLYLLGVHKIDSLKHNLNINEFLKEKQNGI